MGLTITLANGSNITTNDGFTTSSIYISLKNFQYRRSPDILTVQCEAYATRAAKLAGSTPIQLSSYFSNFSQSSPDPTTLGNPFTAGYLIVSNSLSSMGYTCSNVTADGTTA